MDSTQKGFHNAVIDFENFVRDQTVGIFMHYFHRLFIGSIDQTEYYTAGLVYPIRHAFAVMLLLYGQVFLMRLRGIICGQAGDIMDIHIYRHARCLTP
jgi:hypothetical protein